MTDPEVRITSPRRSGHHRGRVWIKFLVLLLFAAAAVVTWQFARRKPNSDLSYSSLETAPARVPEGQAEVLRADQFESTSFARGLNRAVYPYSVVPGGIQSLDELKQVMEHDPVISRQFQGFDFARAHSVQVSDRQAVYVSYRIGQKVYWTRKKIWLHPGETLITDGRIVARARCGNRVAEAPLDAGSPLEPSEEELDQPYSGDPAAVNAASPSDPPPADPSEVAPPAGGRKWWLLPLFAAPLAALPATGGSHEPLAVAPEPGTMLLLSSGLVGVYWRSRKYRRKK
jgi:PEP-CTERM motif-containing protein